ncbi:unnamed protein product [Closterium sp. Yama58-4]|nr:unnamed protein product [Closterium sp. Yama58-4]
MLSWLPMTPRAFVMAAAGLPDSLRPRTPPVAHADTSQLRPRTPPVAHSDASQAQLRPRTPPVAHSVTLISPAAGDAAAAAGSSMAGVGPRSRRLADDGHGSRRLADDGHGSRRLADDGHGGRKQLDGGFGSTSGKRMLWGGVEVIPYDQEVITPSAMHQNIWKDDCVHRIAPHATMSALNTSASLAVDSRLALANQTVFKGQPVTVSIAAPARKAVTTSVSCRADGDNKNASPNFAAQLARAVVPALSSAIFAATVMGVAPTADAMQSYLLTGGVAAAQAEEVAVVDEAAVNTPEERARRLGELLRKKREEQEAIAAAARAEAEKKAAEEEAARRFAEEKIQAQRLFVKPELKPSSTVAPPVKQQQQQQQDAKKKSKRGGMPLFVSQFGVLAAFSGGIAALFVLPDEKWKEIEEGLEEVKDFVLPIVDDVVIPFAEATWEATQEFAETAKPYAEAAIDAAKPVAEAALEAAKPVAEAALEAAKPVAEQAVEKVKELTEPVVSQVEEQVNKVKDVAGPVVSQVGESVEKVKEVAGPVVSQVQEKTAELIKSVEGPPSKPKA